jgi:Lrp/AsnC family transcriptional regulator, leucine-responsive regulatory protein
MNLDDKDMDILSLLKKNAKSTTQQISRELNIPITTVHNRIKKLESSEIISKYTVVLNQKKLGKTISARLAIRVTKLADQNKICNELLNLEAVDRVYQITGDHDIVAKVCLKDIEELHSLIMTQLRTMPEIQNTSTTIVLKEFRK